MVIRQSRAVYPKDYTVLRVNTDNYSLHIDRFNYYMPVNSLAGIFKVISRSVYDSYQSTQGISNE